MLGLSFLKCKDALLILKLPRLWFIATTLYAGQLRQDCLHPVTRLGCRVQCSLQTARAPGQAQWMQSGDCVAVFIT